MAQMATNKKPVGFSAGFFVGAALIESGLLRSFAFHQDKVILTNGRSVYSLPMKYSLILVTMSLGEKGLVRYSSAPSRYPL